MNEHTEGRLIELTNLTKDYQSPDSDTIRVLRNVNLRIDRGEMVAIMGPSGSGKSTMLFVLGLFLLPTSGEYRFAGQDVLSLGRSAQADFRRNRVGFVFQSADLLENSTVYENLEFPLVYARFPHRDRPERIRMALEQVNLGHRLHHPANRLSGGERQRVAVARALVNQPQVILADEPTGQLDRDNSQQVMDHFAVIVGRGETGLVLVTHDAQVAARCHRVYLMDDGALWEKV
jgi:putative ABC transport system ATP-binding protein